MRGTFRKISLPRRVIIDLMRASRGVPFVSLSRSLDVSELVGARALVARPPGWAAIFVKAFALVARDEPILRTLFTNLPWPSFYVLPCSVATVAVSRIVDGEECVLPQRVTEPEALALAEIDAQIRHAKDAPIDEVLHFRKVLLASKLPYPFSRISWLTGVLFGRQRGNYFGSFSVTGVAAYGGGELHALTPGPYILSFDVVAPDQSIKLLIKWDHRVTDGALIARTMTRLEQVLNGEISAEIRSLRAPTENAIRAVAT
jgi:hypothetical protein